MATANNPFKHFPHEHKWVLNGFETSSGSQYPKYICAVCGKEKKKQDISILRK